jgi:diadenosine tetraphosphate (Ap4A) HIT family hydrolase
MDVTRFSDADLARLALSVRLREMSEAFRVAVAADADGDRPLAARLWSLLENEVPALQEAIVQHVRANGGSWAEVAVLGAMSEDEARERWKAVETTRTPDPIGTSASLDEWYIRHAQLEPLAQVRDPFSRLLHAFAPKGHECLICVKYKGGAFPAYGGSTTPPGGYLVQDGLFRVSHGPTPYWPAGTLLIESYRHFLDWSDLTDDEVAAIGPLIRRLVGPVRTATGAPRVHVFSCMEGTEHFHTWLVPRTGEVSSGRTFIADPGFCTFPEAEAAIHRIRAAMDGAAP